MHLQDLPFQEFRKKIGFILQKFAQCTIKVIFCLRNFRQKLSQFNYIIINSSLIKDLGTKLKSPF